MVNPYARTTEDKLKDLAGKVYGQYYLTCRKHRFKSTPYDKDKFLDEFATYSRLSDNPTLFFNLSYDRFLSMYLWSTPHFYGTQLEAPILGFRIKRTLRYNESVIDYIADNQLPFFFDIEIF